MFHGFWCRVMTIVGRLLAGFQQAINPNRLITTPHQDLKKPADGDFSATSPTGTSNARSDRAGNAYFSVPRAAVRRSV
jgi:hypothetical protein